jgi:hypothetical protein
MIKTPLEIISSMSRANFDENSDRFRRADFGNLNKSPVYAKLVGGNFSPANFPPRAIGMIQIRSVRQSVARPFD